MALALRHRRNVNGNAANGVEGHGGRGLRPVFRPGFFSLGRRQYGGDIAHVRNAGLDHRRIADAVEPAFGPRDIPARLQFVQRASLDAARNRLSVIAGIQERAGRRPVGKPVGRHQVSLDHVQWIEFELDGDALHQPLQREIDLRPAKPAVQAGGRLVGNDDPISHCDVGDIVRAGQIAVHAVKRGRLRRAQMRPAVFHLIPAEGQNPAVGRDGGRKRGRAVGRGYRGGEVLETILDPLDRTSDRPRCRGKQHNVGKHALLDAKTAAGIRRGAQPHPIARYFQRPRDHRVDAEGALEIGKDIEGVLGRVVVGDHAVGLDRRA